jgi:hypothetical protein
MFIQSRKNKGELRRKLIEVCDSLCLFLGRVDLRLVLLMRMDDNYYID